MGALELIAPLLFVAVFLLADPMNALAGAMVGIAVRVGFFSVAWWKIAVGILAGTILAQAISLLVFTNYVPTVASVGTGAVICVVCALVVAGRKLAPVSKARLQ